MATLNVYSIYLIWQCDWTQDHPQIEHEIEEVEQQASDVESGRPHCPQCGQPMHLQPDVRIRA